MFIKYVGNKGSLANMLGEELYSVIKFYQVLTIYPKPVNLLSIYERTVLPHIYKDLVLMLQELLPQNMVSLFKNSELVSGTKREHQDTYK